MHPDSGSMTRPVLVGLFVGLAAACGGGEPAPADTTSSSEPTLPPIVAQAVEFHGGATYDASRMTMTISSLSGSFQIETERENGRFEHVVTGTTRDGVERRVRLTNDVVEEWHDGEPVELDQEMQRRARAYVDARVFFPLLPYTLVGNDIHFEDLGLEEWDGRSLHRVAVSFTPGTSNDADDGYTFWFDPDTGRMEQFGYDFNGGLRFRKAVEFERVGGVVFSTQDNYAVDGERVPVATLSPEYVAENMSLLSTVRISDVTVEPL